jgi:hypothetical protein
MFGRGNLIDFNDREIKEEIMTDAKIAGTDVDEATGAKGSGTVSVQMSSIDLENQFNAMIKANLGGYNAGKSISNIKLAIIEPWKTRLIFRARRSFTVPNEPEEP